MCSENTAKTLASRIKHEAKQGGRWINAELLLLFPFKGSVITLLHGGHLVLHRTCVTNLWSHSSFLLAFPGCKVNTMKLESWLSVSHCICTPLLYIASTAGLCSLTLTTSRMWHTKLKAQKSQPQVTAWHWAACFAALLQPRAEEGWAVSRGWKSGL